MKDYSCEWCGKLFKDYPSQRKGKVAFCSKQHKYEWNKTQVGYWRGKLIPFYPRPNRDILGSKNPNWRGGKRVDKDGYILVLQKDHPYADSYHGYVREHRLVMEKKIGRYLKPEEVVHHVNHKKDDNREENLILVSNGAEHQRLHYHNGDSKHLKHYTP